ncbi:hypothetical protein WJX74_008715 [Apatococcus lobatus]|uniref:Uncharacterized protein n=1 Tax=Apatococcus lobatus TaxID=904363 RepID=A0AAW1RHY0_9CHLO
MISFTAGNSKAAAVSPESIVWSIGPFALPNLQLAQSLARADTDNPVRGAQPRGAKAASGRNVHDGACPLATRQPEGQWASGM